MRTRPITKASIPFFCRIVPAIGITLLGVKLAVMAITVGFTPASIAPSTPTTLISTTSQADPLPIETLLPVEDGFKTAARIEKVLVTDLPMPSQDLSYQRRIVLVTLPDGMGQADVDANLRVVCREVFEDGAMSVLVVASSGVGTGSKQIASLTFAPQGTWAKTDRIYDLCEYSAVIWHWGNDEFTK